MVFSQALKVQSTTETGATTSNMARVKSVGLMQQNMSVSSNAGKRRAKGFSAGQTGPIIKEPFWTTRFTATESTSGLKRVVFTRDTGKRIGCTVKAALNMQTEEYSMAFLLRTKSMETDALSGQTEESTEEPM